MKPLVLISILLVTCATSVSAWEKDLHYGLTLWLGLQAGFTKPEALAVAESTQSEDEGKVNPATWMMFHVFLFGDKPGSQTVSEKHFPTDGQIDSPPPERPVVPNSAPARVLLDAVIKQYSGPDELNRLGRALHPFQDSWSHQGIPDTPLRPGAEIHPNLSWSHPQERGGWYSHNADITSLYPKDAIATAKATYQALVDFRGKHPNPRRGEAKNWEDLAADVESFAKAATKEEKEKWFATRLPAAGINAAKLVKDIDIAGEVSFSERVVQIADLPRKVLESEIPKTVVERLGRLVNDLFQSQSVGAASEQLDAHELQRQFGAEVLHSEEEARKWGRKFMTSLLIGDHGAVNAAGHTFPLAEGYASLPEAPENQGRFRKIKTRLEGTVRAESIGKIDFPEVGQVYAIVLSFSDEPNDSVAILANSKGKVVRLLWTII
jgi:hypothetical protein